MSRETMASESLSFGAALFKLRASPGITQTEIAALSHLNRGYYSQLENGRRQAPPARTVEKIGLALGLSNGNLQEHHMQYEPPWKLLGHSVYDEQRTPTKSDPCWDWFCAFALTCRFGRAFPERCRARCL